MGFLSGEGSLYDSAVGAVTDFYEWTATKTKQAYDTAVGATTDAFESIAGTTATGVGAAVDAASNTVNKVIETVLDSDKNTQLGNLTEDQYAFLGNFTYPKEIQSIDDGKIRHYVEISISEIKSDAITVEKATETVVSGFSETFDGLKSAAEKASKKISEGATDPEAVVQAGLAGVQESASTTLNLAAKLGTSTTETFKGMIKTVKKEAATNKLVATLKIYMPDTIFFNQRNDYSERRFDQVFGKLGQVAQIGSSLAGDLSQQVSAGSVSGMFNSLLRNPGGREFAGGFASTLGIGGESLTEGLLKGAGFALNPQVELFFTGVDRRTFQFDFRFNSRSKNETQQIQKIIKLLRKHAAPTIASEGSGRYFIPPSIFDIDFKYIDLNKEHIVNDKIPKINRCVLDSIDINYNGSGKYVTYEDGQPIDIEVRLVFMETDIMTRTEIENGY